MSTTQQATTVTGMIRQALDSGCESVEEIQTYCLDLFGMDLSDLTVRITLSRFERESSEIEIASKFIVRVGGPKKAEDLIRKLSGITPAN